MTRVRRLPLAVLLAGLLVAGVVAGNRHSKAVGVHESRLAAAIPAASVRSSAWYCSGGPVGSGPSADRVTISNTGAVAVPVTVDVMVAGRATAEQLVNVAARTSRTLAVSSVSHDPAAALVVQPLGPGVVVAQGWVANGDLASAPCATRTASSWYFAAGSSRTGAQEWLSLLDPYPVDAVVDVQAYSENGLRAPSSLQDLIVRAHSRLAVRIDPLVAQQQLVALQVHVRNGQRVVATTALVRPSGGGGDQASLSLGATAPASAWWFADNRNRAGAHEELVLANPGDADATARLQLVSDVSAVIQTRVVKVPAATAVAVDLSAATKVNADYTLALQSSVPIVAETRATFDGSQPPLAGGVSELGATTVADQWWFAGGPFTATGRGGGAPRVPRGYQALIVMKPATTDASLTAVLDLLHADSRVRRTHLITRQEALASFTAANRDNPALVSSATAKDQSPAFAVDFENGSARRLAPATLAREPERRRARLRPQCKAGRRRRHRRLQPRPPRRSCVRRRHRGGEPAPGCGHDRRHHRARSHGRDLTRRFGRAERGGRRVFVATRGRGTVRRASGGHHAFSRRAVVILRIVLAAALLADRVDRRVAAARATHRRTGEAAR